MEQKRCYRVFKKIVVILLGGRQDYISLPALVCGNEKLKAKTEISSELIILWNSLVFKIY